ncbi:MAG: DUF4388 domain-containing protein [Myxococcota bacterium]
MSDASAAQLGSGFHLSAEVARALGARAGQGARTVGRAGRMRLVEVEGGNGPAVPWDRDLVLCGDVRAFPLADLLQLVHTAGKSGFLLFQFAAEEKAIYLSRGEVVFAESNLESDRLGLCLLRVGMLSREQLETAEGRFQGATRFGKVLVELGYLTPRDLWEGVKTQVEEIVRSLFSYTAGWIHFWEGEIEPDNTVRLSLPTHRLIDEGLARRDELLRFIAQLEDPRTRIRARAGARRTPCSENERAVLDALAGEGSYGALCHRTGLDPRTAARTLQFLLLTAQVQIDSAASGAGDDFATADDDVVREAVSLHCKLIFELTAPLVAVDGPQAVAERINRIVAESVARGRRLFAGLAFDARAGLDPSLVEHRALRLPGDRIREVDETLGEVVAYLEFELRNHPRIPDAAPFLEAVDSLRAMLIR